MSSKDDDIPPGYSLSREERDWRKERANWNRFVIDKMRRSYQDHGYSKDLEQWRSMIV